MNRSLVRQFFQWLWREWLRPCALPLLAICAIRSSCADWNDVPTGSMQPTIVEGDRVWVNKLAYDLKVPFTTWHLAEWDNPKRGDIVVFFSPHDGQRLVKRVIGLPGDKIEMRRGQLRLNGAPVEYGESTPATTTVGNRTISAEQSVESLPEHPHRVQSIPAAAAMRDFEPVIVPEGRYFMMGDNRDNSFDSRYFGPVERSRIVGRAASVVVSFEPGRLLKTRDGRWFSSLD